MVLTMTWCPCILTRVAQWAFCVFSRSRSYFKVSLTNHTCTTLLIWSKNSLYHSLIPFACDIVPRSVCIWQWASRQCHRGYPDIFFNCVSDDGTVSTKIRPSESRNGSPVAGSISAFVTEKNQAILGSLSRITRYPAFICALPGKFQLIDLGVLLHKMLWTFGCAFVDRPGDVLDVIQLVSTMCRLYRHSSAGKADFYWTLLNMTHIE